VGAELAGGDITFSTALGSIGHKSSCRADLEESSGSSIRCLCASPAIGHHRTAGFQSCRPSTALENTKFAEPLEISVPTAMAFDHFVA
jgi:hypothetical protein